MFFEAKNDKPVKVDGTLVIYAFDETRRDPSNPKPDRKYVSPPSSCRVITAWRNTASRRSAIRIASGCRGTR